MLIRLALLSSVLADLGRVEQFLRNRNTKEACDVPCEYFAELFSDLDDEIKALKAENDLIKEDLTRLTIENVEQNSKINTLQGESNDQNVAIESNAVSISTIDDSVSNLSESLQDTQGDMLLLSTQVDEMTADLVDVQKSVGDLDNNIVSLSDDLTTVTSSVDALENNFVELSDNFEELTDELDDIIGHDNTTDNELDDLKDQVADLASDLTTLDEIVQDIDDDLTSLSTSFEDALIVTKEWQNKTDDRLDAIESSLGQTTTQPDVEPTQPPTDCPNEAEKTECLHWCDQTVVICLTQCDSHDNSCLSDCWRDQDQCHKKCPCNENCPNGCVGCSHWSCPENLTGECPDDATCPPQGDCLDGADDKKIDCGDDKIDTDGCLALGCCWQPVYDSNGNYPWCSYPV